MPSDSQPRISLVECPRCESLFHHVIHLTMSDADGNDRRVALTHTFCPWDGTKLRLLDGRVLPEERYRLVRALGGGGFACVYLAKEVGILGRILKAVKVFLPDVYEIEKAYQSEAPHLFTYFPGSRTQAERLLEEARRMADLPADRCSNLPRVDIPRETPWPHFAMEYLHGEPLSEILSSKKKLSWDEARPYLRGIVQGLGAIYEVGSQNFHGDLKPSNVLVLSGKVDRDEDRIKLLDFGLSAIIRREGNRHATSLPQTSTLERKLDSELLRIRTPPPGGTPAYMAPESFDKPESRGRASDFYAFGVMLYEMLTGTLPFKVPRRHVQWSAWSMAHRTLDPPPLPVGTRRIRRLFRRCMEKDPEKRPRSTEEILAALREPLTRRQKLLRISACSLVILALGAGALVAHMSRNEPLALSIKSPSPGKRIYFKSDPEYNMVFWSKPGFSATFTITNQNYVLDEAPQPVQLSEEACVLYDHRGKRLLQRRSGGALSILSVNMESSEFTVEFPEGVVPDPGNGSFYVLKYKVSGDCTRQQSRFSRGHFTYTLWWIADLNDPEIETIRVVPKTALDPKWELKSLEEHHLPLGKDVGDTAAPCRLDNVNIEIQVRDTERGLLPTIARDLIDITPEGIPPMTVLPPPQQTWVNPITLRLCVRFNGGAYEPITVERRIPLPTEGETAQLDIEIGDGSGSLKKKTVRFLHMPQTDQDELDWPTVGRPEGQHTDWCDFLVPTEPSAWYVMVVRNIGRETEKVIHSGSVSDLRDQGALLLNGSDLVSDKKAHKCSLRLDHEVTKSEDVEEQTFLILLWTDIVGAWPYRSKPLPAKSLPPDSELILLTEDSGVNDREGIYYAKRPVTNLLFGLKNHEFVDIKSIDPPPGPLYARRADPRSAHAGTLGTFILEDVTVSPQEDTKGGLELELKVLNTRADSFAWGPKSIRYYPPKTALECRLAVERTEFGKPGNWEVIDSKKGQFPHYLKSEPRRLAARAEDGRPLRNLVGDIEGSPLSSEEKKDGYHIFELNGESGFSKNRLYTLRIEGEDYVDNQVSSGLRIMWDQDGPSIESSHQRDGSNNIFDMTVRDAGSGLTVKDVTVEASYRGRWFTSEQCKIVAEPGADEKTVRITAIILDPQWFCQRGEKGQLLFRVVAQDRAQNPRERVIRCSGKVQPEEEFNWDHITWRIVTDVPDSITYATKYEITNRHYHDYFFADLADLEEKQKKSYRPRSWGQKLPYRKAEADHPVWDLSIKAALEFAEALHAEIPDRATWTRLWSYEVKREVIAAYRALIQRRGSNSLSVCQVDRYLTSLELEKSGEPYGFYHVVGNVPELVVDKGAHGRHVVYRFVGGGATFDLRHWLDMNPEARRHDDCYPFGLRLMKKITVTPAAIGSNQFLRKALKLDDDPEPSERGLKGM